MSEIFTNTTQFVYLDIVNGTADGTPTATANGQTLTVNGPTDVNGTERWTATLDFAQTANVGEVVVIWNFSVGGTAASKTEYFDVVVPLADLDDIRDELEIPTDVTDPQIIRAERKVRKLIENYCGQKFSPSTETVLIAGKGQDVIWLPKRLISVTTATNHRTGLDLTGFEIRSDGWALKRTLSFVDSEIVSVNGPIYDPFYFGSYNWPAGYEWDITGVWGWNRVPEAVKEAALLLIEQRLCPESMYRDNYLTSMKAADWRMDISPTSFFTTGHNLADHLLSDYIRVAAAVV